MSIASFITVLRLFLTCIDLIISINFIWLYRYTATLGVCSESYGSTCCWCYSECVKHGVLVWIGKPRGLWYIEGSCWSADTILGLWTGTLQCEISLFFVICTFDSDFDVYRVVFSEHLLVLSGCKCYTVHPVFYRLYAFVHHTVDMAIFFLSVCLSVCLLHPTYERSCYLWKPGWFDLTWRRGANYESLNYYGGKLHFSKCNSILE